jgi:hypothetical protein
MKTGEQSPWTQGIPSPVFAPPRISFTPDRFDFLATKRGEEEFVNGIELLIATNILRNDCKNSIVLAYRHYTGHKGDREF